MYTLEYILIPARRPSRETSRGVWGMARPQYRKTSITMIVYMKYMIIYVFPPADGSENKAGGSGGRHATQKKKQGGLGGGTPPRKKKRGVWARVAAAPIS